MHLTENNIQELAYAYVKKVRLSDKQVGFKRHMADCDSCFYKFMVERELQDTLLSSGLISDDVMKEVLSGQEEVQAEKGHSGEKILFRMKKTAEGFRMLIEEAKERADSLWNFYPAPQMAFSRSVKGTEEDADETEIYANSASKYSMIRVTKEGLLVRLDEADYQADRFVLQVTKQGEVKKIPFVYNEEEESYDAFVAGAIEEGTQFEIVEESDED